MHANADLLQIRREQDFRVVSSEQISCYAVHFVQCLRRFHVRDPGIEFVETPLTAEPFSFALK